MKFSIEYTDHIEQRTLKYHIEEWSFDTEPSIQEINFDVVINKLNLTTIDNDNRIAQIWGFCGLDKNMKSNYMVPESKIGILKVIDDLECGFAYGISSIADDEFSVYVNVQTGWICIGNPEKKGNAVEFINNCIAVINDDKEFISLWLKPQSLPQI